jgi:signal transduction histidine kinase
MRDSNLNREYAEYDRGVRLSNVRIASLLVILLMPFGAILDWFVYPQYLLPFLGLRLVCSLATGLAWLLLESRWQKQVYPYLIHAWYLMPTLAISLMIAFSQGVVSPYYAGLNLVILAVSAVMQTGLTESLFTIGAIFGLYLGACLLHGRLGSSSAVFGNLYFLIVTALIVLAGNYNYNRLRYREFVLRHQLGESQRQLESSNLQLRELDEAKSRFFANISHELRTPLTLIASPIEKLRQNQMIKRDPDLFQLVGIMEANSLRLLRMINNLLDLVRLENNRNAAVKSAVNIDEMLKGLLTSVEHVARTKGIRLKSDFEPTERPLLIDQDRMEKIVLNLLLNAIKFTSADGEVSLTWHIAEERFILEVKDSGIGIAQEDLGHIFDRFWQANTSSTRKFQGVGIGLALVKELTESLQGRVEVESRLETGSKFTVTVPVEFAAEETSVPPPAVSPPAKEAPADEWLASLYRRADLFIDPEAAPSQANHVDLARRKRPLVLIGEDQPDMAAFIAAQLKDDFDLLVAADGQYVIDMTRQYQPDLLVLDLMMPEKDGLEVCRELEGEVKARGLPILILTARADDETKLKVLQSGATDFLTKPFSTTELQTRCRNLVALALLGGRVASQNQELRRSMEQIKESEVRMVQHAKMISLGRMSAGLIHEINNPLNYVMSAVRLLRRKCENSPRAALEEIFADIDHGLKRVSDLVSSLRTFSHPTPRQFEAVNLLTNIMQACRLTSTVDTPAIRPVIEVAPHLTVWGNGAQLNQVFINLIQNAIDACHARLDPDAPPRIHISAREDEGEVTVKISDNGEGIPLDIIDKIFDPFFTTKDVGSGMGLGLSICHAIIKSHAGRLDVQSEPSRGTVAILTLPSLSPSEKSSSNPAQVEEHYESLVRL